MAADKEAIGFSRIHLHYFKCNSALQDICLYLVRNSLFLHRLCVEETLCVTVMVRGRGIVCGKLCRLFSRRTIRNPVVKLPVFLDELYSPKYPFQLLLLGSTSGQASTQGRTRTLSIVD